jgi:hypothetical protein
MHDGSSAARIVLAGDEGLCCSASGLEIMKAAGSALFLAIFLNIRALTLLYIFTQTGL